MNEELALRLGLIPALFRRHLNPLFNFEGEGGGEGGGAGGAGGGEGGETWQTELPEGIQDWDEVKNSDSPEKFWDQMTTMRTHVGQSIRVPSKEAGEEDWSAFNAKLKDKVPSLINKPDLTKEDQRNQFYGSLGRPEKAEEYNLPEFKEENVDTTQAEAFRTVAHKHGLSQTQFEGVVSDISNINFSEAAKTHEAQQKDHEGLQKEWGFAFDKNTKTVENFLAQSGAPEPILNILKEGMMDAASKKWFLALSTKLTGEGQNLTDDDTTLKGAMTPAEATKRISEIMNNKEHPYWNKLDPAHGVAAREMRKLYEYKLGADAKKAAPGSSFNAA